MQSITVLTPHARRMVVKIDGNKTLLWVKFANSINLPSHNK